ncbi:hypothetical protein V6N11_035392 [Hibiscus sabdariffa]|uniref:Uncharacterized protein n=1 Tax=Hibiscus sabdariffa TaxID=183260 RepID=A0ABR2R0T2_9ROSI
MENKLSRENGLCVLVQNKGLLVLPNCMAPSLWDGVAKSPLEAANHVVKLNTITEHGFQLDNVDLVTSRVLEDIQCMDLQDVNNAQVDLGDSIILRDLPGTLNERGDFFPELVSKRRKEKRYGSLFKFQDKVLILTSRLSETLQLRMQERLSREEPWCSGQG